MILFICEAMVCMPSIAATSEASAVETEGEKANTRIQGGILCDALGSLLAGLGMTIPMVSHAGEYDKQVREARNDQLTMME